MVESTHKKEKMINFIMKDGKKSVAETIYRKTLQEIKAN